MEAASDKDKPKIQIHRQCNEPTSPVCYANSDEIRDEFKEEMKEEKKEDQTPD